ncbi:hypothetical protein ACFPJ4_02915 [Lysinimonas soli]|uniref:ATP synthase protein I n=1 Tax=Lysinimonas soli TaxID=1074233 RepID=A0ABW0NL93_9MICO
MTVTPVLTRALRYGGIFAVAVAVVAGVVGLLVAGVPGLVGGLLGAALSAVFLGLTAISMLIAGRVAKGDSTSPIFFGIVVGVWLLKLIVFVVVEILLRGQPWFNPYVFFAAIVVVVIGSLVLDGVAMYRARVPYVSDISLPGDPEPKRRP